MPYPHVSSEILEDLAIKLFPIVWNKGFEYSKAANVSPHNVYHFPRHDIRNGLSLRPSGEIPHSYHH